MGVGNLELSRLCGLQCIRASKSGNADGRKIVIATHRTFNGLVAMVALEGSDVSCSPMAVVRGHAKSWRSGESSFLSVREAASGSADCRSKPRIRFHVQEMPR